MSDIPLRIPEKIQVLLAEYETLRDEILERNTALNQYLTVSVTGAIAIFTVAAAGNPRTVWIAVVLFVLVPPVIWMIFKILEFDTLAAAKRLVELEAQINTLAGEKLLVWETENGLYKVAYKPRFRASLISSISLLLFLAFTALIYSVYAKALGDFLDKAYQQFASWMP